MVFGNGKTWMDIEADEVTFNSTDLKDLAEDSNRPVIWEQWSAIAQRGRPDTWGNRLQPRQKGPWAQELSERLNGGLWERSTSRTVV